MIPQIREWLARNGFPSDIEVVAMAGGLGHTEMWRVRAGGAHGDLVFRVFPSHDTVSCAREVLAMRVAATRGLPVPTVVATGEIDERPALLMTLVPGETVASVLERRPGDAFVTGERLGRLLGELNGIPAPEGLAPEGAWLERAGPALAPLRGRLSELPNPHRLLHLDYHAENVLMDGDEVTGIIDWTNTLPGPPHIDLGRSRAILHLVQTLPTVPAEVAATVARFEEGLVAAHEAVHGPDPAPRLTLAWGLGMTCVDFAPQAERPESWVTPALVRELEARRDRLIARAAGSP